MKEQAWFYDMLSNHKRFMRKQVDPLPIWLVYRKDGIDNCGAVPNEDADKFSPNVTVSEILQAKNPDIWILFSEAWCALSAKVDTVEEAKRQFHRGDVSKLPDKVEMLTVFGKTRDKKEVISESYWLIRNDQGRIIDFKKTPMHKMEALYLP